MSDGQIVGAAYLATLKQSSPPQVAGAATVLARKFWESSIAKFTGQPAQSTQFVKDGVAWHRFSLDSRR